MYSVFKMADVVCMGELLIDFVPTESGVALVDASAFKKAPGGAPANVAVGLSRLGISSAFMGKVGDDDFGRFLAQTLEDNGVDTGPLVYSKEARTALAFVSLTAEGERDFMFYRHPSADMLFEPAEVDEAAIRQAKVFHYGSISLISEPSKSATLHAVEIAQDAGLLISYDPNLRLPLWSGEEAAREGMLLGWEHATVIKASVEEIRFLTGDMDLAQSVKQLWRPALKLLVVTMGKEGCHYFTAEANQRIPGFEVDVVDTTGAGDGFVAGLLMGVVQHPDLWRDEAALEEMLLFANAVGALTTTERGAIPALPEWEAATALMRIGRI
jgi:fructokinase